MTERASELDYHAVANHFFAVSKYSGSMVLYRRCNFSSKNYGLIHCIDLAYPSEEERLWDDTVTRISRSLRPLYK
jgi:hypothetical protein